MLQLFPDSDRPSFARARVDVQERFDGRLMVQYRGRVLPPGEAPPLANTLRVLASAHTEGSGVQAGMDLSDLIDEEPKAKQQPTGRGWNGDWYREESTKCLHREDRKSTRLNSSHSQISYAVFCL